MSSHCSRRQVASAGGFGGIDLAETRCGRRCATKGSDGGAVGRQVGRGGVAVQGDTTSGLGPGFECGVGRGDSGACGCQTHALGAPRARPGCARRYAMTA